MSNRVFGAEKPSSPVADPATTARPRRRGDRVTAEMKRREFITLIGGAAAWPLSLRAQPAGRIARIGYFAAAPSSGPLPAAIYQAFVDEMQIHGFKTGQNLILEHRLLEQDDRALSQDVADLLRTNVDAFFTDGIEPALRAVATATQTVPIVMIATNFDPFARGYVKSLARPEGNITGVFLRQTELAEKQTELLLDAVPAKQRLAILWDARPVQRRRTSSESIWLTGSLVKTRESALRFPRSISHI